MLKIGKVEKYILEEIAERRTIHSTLIDPDKTAPEDALKIAEIAEEVGSSFIMIGGSLGVTESLLDDLLIKMKERINIPIVLFPGSVSGVSKYADAVWFLSVLTSTSIYHIIGAQVQAAPIVKRYRIEAIPLAYVICGRGGTVGYVSYSRPIPYEKPEIAVAYALAAQYMGFRFVYLEAGSGQPPIHPSFIRRVSSVLDIPLIVGGGINSRELARRATEAGANIIVTGTIVEEATNVKSALEEIIKGIEEVSKCA